MLLTILSGLFGGLLRLAPEVFKFLDAKNDRAHELAMQDKQLEFLKAQGTTKVDEITATGKVQLAQADLDVQTAQFAAYQAAMASQAVMSTNGGKIISAINALVRPGVTAMVFNIWFVYKVAMLIAAFQSSGGNLVGAIIGSWTQDDASMLSMILSFYFVGRTFDKRP